MAMRLDGGQGGAGKKILSPKKPKTPAKAPVSNNVPWTFDVPRAQGQPNKISSTPSAYTVNRTSSVNTGGGGGVGVGATGTVAAQGAAAVPAPPQMTEDEWLAQDAQFLDEKNAATQDYENLIAKLAQQRTDYELDNTNTLRNLGWDSKGNQWNQEDRLTGYGNAYQNQRNDFASRGLMDSSLYAEAQNDLTRGFNQQRTDLATALSNFLAGQATDKSQATNARDAAITSAQRQALQRYAAQNALNAI